MLSVSVHVTGLAATQTKLTAIGAALDDVTDVMESLAFTLIRFFEDTVFSSEGQALLGDRWEGLKPATSAEKDAKWPGRGTLERTGDLRHGFTKEVTPFSLFITNNDPKFLFHQLGTSGGPGRGHNIPAREMLGVNTAVEEIIKHEVEVGVRARIDAVR